MDPAIRKADLFFTIDSGFLNHRLCLSTMPPGLQTFFHNRLQPGTDHLTKRSNQCFLVNLLTDFCRRTSVPTLLQALSHDVQESILFMSVERYGPGDGVFDHDIATHKLLLTVDFGVPVQMVYHTEHLVSSTGKERLAEGAREAIIGFLHRERGRHRVEPLVIGAPLFRHHWNPDDVDETRLMWSGRVLQYGQLWPEDIDQFEKMQRFQVAETTEWTSAMRNLPESRVKECFATLLGDLTKKDWGGETSDHFTTSLSIEGRRRSAAFLFKGPGGGFREMTLDLCGKRADQIVRLATEPADILVVQHCHNIASAVRMTLHAFVQPGWREGGIARKYCLIDGKSTFQILKAYDLL